MNACFRCILCICISMLSAVALPLNAQNTPVSGTVKEAETDESLSGATIQVKGKNKVATSNSDGKFSIDASPNDVLVVSFIGYKTLEVSVRNRKLINISLVSSGDDMDEVVVVGYGTMNKSDVTGSISSLKMKDMDETKATSYTEALQGRLAGVNIVTNSGEPGGAVSFNIRGMTSVTGSNQPLIVIDGQPIESSFGAGYASGSGGDGNADAPPGDPLAAISPNDIESIEVLKDASSTAIYGSRGANGVVLITTKSGKTGKDRINFSTRIDMSQLPRKIEMLNNYEFMLYKNEGWSNDGTAANPPYNQKQLDSILKSPNTSWQDLVYRNAISQDFNLSVSGTEKDKWNYLLSANYANMNSVIKNAGFQRGGLRLNVDRQVGKKLKISMRTFASYTRRDFGLQSNWTGILSGSTILSALVFNPLQIPFTEEDGEEINTTVADNPLTQIENVHDNTTMRTFISSLSLEYKINPWLTYQLKGAVNDITTKRKLFYPTGTWLGDQYSGYASHAGNNNYNYLIDHILTFKKVYKKKHSVNAVGGFSWQQWFNNSDGVNNTGFPSNTLTYNNMQGAENFGRYFAWTARRALASVIGRVNYTYDRRYSVMATGRYDGSSRLAPGNQWFLYPSLGVSWNATNEKFFRQNLRKYIYSFKFRGSVGVTGNDNVGIGASQASYGINFYPLGTSIVPGYVMGRFDNPALTWEETVQYNLGGDFGFLRDRLTFSIDAYQKTTTGLLIDLALPQSTGLGSYSTNVGKVTNKGLDIEASFNAIRSKKKSLTFSGNISPIKSKIENLGPASIIYGRLFFVGGNLTLSQSLTAAVPGYGLSSFWGYETNGIYQNQAEINNDPAIAAGRDGIKPGMIKYVDQNGDGQITEADKTVIGDAMPDFTYGFTTEYSVGRFSATMTLFGSQGAQLMNLNRWVVGSNHTNTNYNSMKDAYEGRWYGEGTSNRYPALYSTGTRLQQRFPDWMVEDASFIRLQNITLGYAFPLPKKYRLGDLKLSFTGTNLFTITKYTGYDPNINAMGTSSLNNGVDLGTLGQPRSFSTTLKLMF